jgi:hypothetical protein
VRVIEALISKGVDGTRTHAYSASGRGGDDDDGPVHLRDRTDCTLLELAVERLSGDVVSFLLGHGHAPSTQELLSKAVGRVFLCSSGDDAALKNRMAADRLSILQQLVSAGLVVADSAPDVMKEALRAMDDVLRDEKRPTSARCNPVPVTRESLCWLCAQGCDLASVVERGFVLRNGDVSTMLADLVRLSETIWPVADAISRGEPFDDVERLVQRSGASSIHAIRDPLGRTLVQVAVLSDQAQHLKWLVTVKGAKLDEQGDYSEDAGLTVLDLARQNGLHNIVNTLTRLRQLQPP